MRKSFAYIYIYIYRHMFSNNLNRILLTEKVKTTNNFQNFFSYIYIYIYIMIVL